MLLMCIGLHLILCFAWGQDVLVHVLISNYSANMDGFVPLCMQYSSSLATARVACGALPLYDLLAWCRLMPACRCTSPLKELLICTSVPVQVFPYPMALQRTRQSPLPLPTAEVKSTQRTMIISEQKKNTDLF